MKRTLVVLTGWARDHHSYKKLIQSAPNDWQILVPSYNKLGLHKGIDTFGKNLSSFVKAQNSPVSILGHSLGGALAIHFVASYPGKIEKLLDRKSVV